MSYLPDESAVLDGTAFTRQLSQRDLSLQIPLNYVTVPGIALTPACFADQKYEHTSAIKCLSNLLAVGFRRFEVDTYWDVSRNVWSLCPIQLGDLNGRSIVSSTERSVGSGEHADAVDILPRQDDAATGVLTFSTTAAQASTQSLPSISTTVVVKSGDASPTSTLAKSPQQTDGSSTTTAFDVDDYTCTESATLKLVLRVLSSHLDSTQTNVNATIDYLILNLHEAANSSGEVSLLKQDLPTGDSRLSSIVVSPATNISEYLYTPDDLRTQRADLNASFSWYSVNPLKETESAYFTVDKSRGNAFTPNGWPGESFVELTQAKRLLVGVGKVDAQLRNYNLTADASTIFGPGYLNSPASVELTTDGQLTDGCYFDPDITTISRLNNSWSESGLNGSRVTTLAPGLTAANTLTDCGITPILKITPDNRTADEDHRPYHEFIESTIWSWAPGEPRNNTDPNDDDSSTSNRCAVLGALSGYWHVDDCAASHHSACRKSGEPYRWTISQGHNTYEDAGYGCTDGATFETPRTALENRYLLHAWREVINARDFDGDSLLWVDFNDLDTKACWVIGQNATCPYLKGGDHDREVVVPVVAGVIVFVLAALTLFVKCASNRQTVKRRRRRGDDGWDYEGVPS